ncbi:MAG: SRPBCC domain-containing protein [Melioribacteraceae bacterium]|nr:SRPBCC domain-containing protein [Melioribacteraceae bacterium]MCF8356856.1 SRPBCC domain-containing protein [Melioribacteraceae bacterium]MCF8396235.1 SRPBCC domain-containing protein [Melioribacteraceae bacterium]MCF8421159.1 SRPBCC domain-containing protein [Melioribacteraceae bacterium]
MKQKEFDWTYFKRRIYINNCSKEELFRKWATPKGITEWFIEEADYKYGDNTKRKPDEIVRAGDKYWWKFHRGSVVEGTVLEVKENSLFKFTFGKKDVDSDEEVIVTVTINEKNGRCFFDILQENMSESKYGKVNYYISCNMGWMFHMNNLKSICETGNDLRIQDGDRMHVDAPSRYPLDKYKWTEFKQVEYIKALKDKVFQKWTTSKDITEWFIAEATYSYDDMIRKPDEKIKAGDKYSWTFFQGFTMKGKILKIDENEFLAFTFGKKDAELDEDIIVELSFSTDGEKSKIELIQKNMADNEYGHVNHNMSCMVGWCYFLTNLRSLLESGYDLREKDIKLAKETQSYSLDNLD